MYYITTPIYYVNDKPHIGHAYTTLACDCIARFKRLDGHKVKFLTGTDEHGQKIEQAAQKLGIECEEFADKTSQKFKDLTQLMNFSNDIFIRTTEQRHKENAKRIWGMMQDSGDIYKGQYRGWYSTRDEAFYAEDELIDGKSPSGSEVLWTEEECYFFRLSKYQEPLLEFYEQNIDFIAPQSRRNEVISFVSGGLRDLCVSRTSFSWGIDVPNAKNHVMYVWIDALTNYISGLDNYESSGYWPCNLHVVGKDILRFHAVYWPAMLMSANIPLPKKIFAHGWWTNEGEKISKSLGNTIDPLLLIEKFGVDYVRYFFMKEMKFGNDGNYSEQSLILRVNAELVNKIGNLSQRVLSFVVKHAGGRVQKSESLKDIDIKLLEGAYSAIKKVRDLIDEQDICDSISCIVSIASDANEYTDLNAPWKLKETDKQRMHDVLYTLVEVIRVIAILLQPFIPSGAAKLLSQLGINQVQDFAQISDGKISVLENLPQPFGIFPRI